MVHSGAALGLDTTRMLGISESTWGLLWEREVALQQRLGGARDCRAGRPDGGWGGTQRSRSPVKAKGRPSQQGGGPTADWADKE